MQSHHATRIALSNEWHARPSVRLPAPFRCTHIVSLAPDKSFQGRRAEFAELCRAFGQTEPAEDARAHSVEIGSCLVKWESHTEAVGHTILVAGNGQPPFSETALDFMPEALRSSLRDRMFVGVQVETIRSPGDDDPHGYELARSLLGSSTIYGGWMSARSAVTWSSFRLDARGFVRILIVVQEDDEERLARLLHRLLDLETYRMLAMLALPRAREAMSTLGLLERELDLVMRRLAEDRENVDLEQSLTQITTLAAKVEHIAAADAYRFAAARAYAGIVDRRCGEVDEEVVGSHQRYTNFLLRTHLPAMRTCEATEVRIHDLAERVARAASMVDTMVDMVTKQQNQSILESTARSSQLQVKLQQAVEGFSIVAISYYGVGLLGYELKAFKAAGLPLDADLLTGIAAPFVLAAVWLTVRAVKRRLNERASGADGQETD